VNLFEYDIFRVTAIGGIWNSFHSEQTKQRFGSRARDAAHDRGEPQRKINKAFGDPESWYESDAYGGAAFGIGDAELSFIYTAYMSPNGAFKTTQDIAFGASYDDSELLGDFALHPGITFYLETAGPGAFGVAGQRGTLAQLHGGPEFSLTGGDNPITLGIPIEAGLSISDYYESSATTLPSSPSSPPSSSFTSNSKASGVDNATFGYFQTGLDLGVPLAFIPCEYGSWLLNLGGRFISMGRTLKEVNRNGDDYSFFGMFGLSMTY